MILRPATLLLALVPLLQGAAPSAGAATRPAAQSAPRTAPATPVPLQSNPGTRTDATARQLAADDLEAARSRGDAPLVLTGRAVLGGAQPALFVQLQSPQECGSAGCSTSVFSWEGGHWRRVLDSGTGRLTVLAKKTRGRNDILSEDDHFVWTGTAYQSLEPAPALNLHPRPRRH